MKKMMMLCLFLIGFNVVNAQIFENEQFDSYKNSKFTVGDWAFAGGLSVGASTPTGEYAKVFQPVGFGLDINAEISYKRWTGEIGLVYLHHENTSPFYFRNNTLAEKSVSFGTTYKSWLGYDVLKDYSHRLFPFLGWGNGGFGYTDAYLDQNPALKDIKLSETHYFISTGIVFDILGNDVFKNPETRQPFLHHGIFWPGLRAKLEYIQPLDKDVKPNGWGNGFVQLTFGFMLYVGQQTTIDKN
jgi:hypothetical protein